MASRSSQNLSSWINRLDGGFLAVAGFFAMLTDASGHFWGAGPLAGTLGSPQTIGAFEAHGLALILGVFMMRPASEARREQWHTVGLLVHLLLGASNLLFWMSFIQMNLIAVGIVTTALHLGFAVAQSICLLFSKDPLAFAPSFD